MYASFMNNHRTHNRNFFRRIFMIAHARGMSSYSVEEKIDVEKMKESDLDEIAQTINRISDYNIMWHAVGKKHVNSL